MCEFVLILLLSVLFFVSFGRPLRRFGGSESIAILVASSGWRFLFVWQCYLFGAFLCDKREIILWKEGEQEKTNKDSTKTKEDDK